MILDVSVVIHGGYWGEGMIPLGFWGDTCRVMGCVSCRGYRLDLLIKHFSLHYCVCFRIDSLVFCTAMMRVEKKQLKFSVPQRVPTVRVGQ